MPGFYGVPLPRCDTAGCTRPATDEVRGPRGALYGYSCGRHLAARLANLDEVHGQ